MDDFVRKQLAIPVDALSPDERECFCCSTVYGQLQAEGLIEYAVKLECGHILGSGCLSRWIHLSNTCPHCRKQLFPQTYETHDDEFNLVETTIGEVENRLLERFEERREPTEDEVDEMEATGRSGDRSDGSRNTQAIQSWRNAAIRRRSDMHTRELYNYIRLDQIRTGSSQHQLLPDLEPWEHAGGALGWEPDHALFECLRNLGAFCLPGMGMEQRTPPNLLDEEFYDQLRNTGVRFNPVRKGWFKYGNRIVLSGCPPELDEEEQTFRKLQAEGAFRTLGVTKSFRDVRNLFPDKAMLTPTDWEVYQMIRKDKAYWYGNANAWFAADHSVLYGDAYKYPDTTSKKIWHNTRSGDLFVRAGADADTVAYVENLWLPEHH